MSSRAGSSALLSLAFTGLALALDNGLALSPPQGWTSWNTLGCNHLSQTAVEDHIHAVSLRLLQYGYDRVGIDDCWQAACGGGGVTDKGSFHGPSSGRPLINTTRFPNMSAIVSLGQEKGVKVSWYTNNCNCEEEEEEEGGDTSAEAVDRVYRGSVDALVSYNFNGIKIDSCTQFRKYVSVSLSMFALNLVY
jgi:alpha-galactosidase